VKRFAWFALLAGSCGAPPPSVHPELPPSPPASVPAPALAPAPPPLAAEAIAGISDPRLAQVVADHWEAELRANPTFATSLGDHRFDAQLERHDAASIAAESKVRAELIARLDALSPDALVEADRVNRALLRDALAADRDRVEACKSWQWNVGPSQIYGYFANVVEAHTVTSAADARNVIARMREGGRYIDDAIANLKLGLAAGRVAAVGKVQRTLDQLDAELAKPVASWPVASPAWSALATAERDPLVAELGEVVAKTLAPAFARYRAFLHDEILPKARTVEGLTGLPGGEACYRALIVDHVGLPRTAAELHALGVAEIAKSDAAIAALGRRVLKAKDLASTIAALRSDKQLYFTSATELVAAAQRSLDRAKQAIPKYFALLPKADCVMRELPAHEAPYATIAYYRPPHYDGSKPGEYFVNTYKPETRPRFELEALTWHESIPGHHLQIAIAQELGAVPLFRKLSGSTAFVEGWGLYTERLADEMGLYSGDLDRLGQLSYDAWRGSRLVVDTGIHALGWTRGQAEAYLRAHTALTETNIVNEVDRYIGMPGQALAYKVGQLEILALRAEAQRVLGAGFDIRQFHRVVLEAGAVTLPVLAARVRAWIAASR
jgi:uncharacterized protein (DUF885 family)